MCTIGIRVLIRTQPGTFELCEWESCKSTALKRVGTNTKVSKTVGLITDLFRMDTNVRSQMLVKQLKISLKFLMSRRERCSRGLCCTPPEQ